MLQDIKRSIGEDFSVEYRNYIILQKKIREDVENEKHTFVERTQGAEMSLFIENVYSSTSSAFDFSNGNQGDIDSLVQMVFDRKKYIETVEKENETEHQNFMNNVIASISDNYTENAKNVPARRSVDVVNDTALRKIFKSIPKSTKIKVTQQLRSRLGGASTIEPQASDMEEDYFRASSNNLQMNRIAEASLKLLNRKNEDIALRRTISE